MATATVKTYAKSELKEIAQNMISENKRVMKSAFAKSFPYSDFLKIYTPLAEKNAQKNIDIAAKKEKLEFCKENKISMKVLENAILLLKNIKLSEYSTGHSMGSNRYLYIKGAKTNYRVSYYSNCDTYAKSCSYRPTWGYVGIFIDIEMVKALQNTTFSCIGNVDTFTVNGNEKIKKCFYLTVSGSKNTYAVKMVEGYITSGYHGKSIEDCQNWRKKQALRLTIQRAKNPLEIIGSKFVGLKHSKEVGNCEEGTKNFAKKHKLDIKMGYRIDYLISLEDSQYTRRLLNYSF